MRDPQPVNRLRLATPWIGAGGFLVAGAAWAALALGIGGALAGADRLVTGPALLAVLGLLLGAGAALYLVLRRARDASRAATQIREVGARREKALIDQHPDGVLLLSAGVVTYANDAAARLLGVPAADRLVGEPLIRFVALPERAAIVDLLRGCERDVKPVAFRPAVFQQQDGKPVHAEMALAPLRLPARTDVQMVLRDVAEQHALAAQLRQSQKMEAVGRLAGGVAHDFNNLLTVMAGHAEMILVRHEMEEGEEHPEARSLNGIRGAAQRAAVLVRRLLSFSRKGAVHLEVLSLNEVLEDTRALALKLLDDGTSLVLEPSIEAGSVRAGRAELEQVILNLVVNARDAMPEGGTVTVRTGAVDLGQDEANALGGLKPGVHAWVSVTDTGTGMDADTLERIFEPFFTTKQEGKGTGLGLSTTHAIVTDAGGSMRVETKVNEGTTFTVFLPRVQGAALTDRRKPRAMGEADLATGVETVLVVEDRAAVREIAVAVLEHCGYQVLKATGGSEALRLARLHSGPIDLLLADVGLADMDGTEVARRIRSKRPETKVLFMTGYAGTASDGVSLQEAGHAVLAKPFTPQGLSWRVREVLEADGPGPGESIPSPPARGASRTPSR